MIVDQGPRDLDIVKEIAWSEDTRVANSISVKMNDIARWEQYRFHSIGSGFSDTFREELIQQGIQNVFHNGLAERFGDNGGEKPLQFLKGVLDIASQAKKIMRESNQ